MKTPGCIRTSTLEITEAPVFIPEASACGDGGGLDKPPTLVGGDSWPDIEKIPKGPERDEVYRRFAGITIRMLTSEIGQ